MSIDKKKLTPIALVSIFFLMLGLSFAAVPLYELFCRVTGFGGTTQNASNKEIPKIVINQDYKMRFDTNINGTLNWKFNSWAKYKNFKNTIKNYQKFIKDNFKFVGKNFAYEARSIHYNPKKKSKGVYGNASKKDLAELKEEGIDAQMIPWVEDKDN